MSQDLFDIVSAQGVWAVLSVFLILYILKAQEKRDDIQAKREEKYQEIIGNMTNKLEILRYLSDDVSEIKVKLHEAIKK